MSGDVKYDVVTMVSNYRKDVCAKELMILLKTAKDIDLKLLKEIIPIIDPKTLSEFFVETPETIFKYISALNTFCQTVQNLK